MVDFSRKSTSTVLPEAGTFTLNAYAAALLGTPHVLL